MHRSARDSARSPQGIADGQAGRRLCCWLHARCLSAGICGVFLDHLCCHHGNSGSILIVIVAAVVVVFIVVTGGGVAAAPVPRHCAFIVLMAPLILITPACHTNALCLAKLVTCASTTWLLLSNLEGDLKLTLASPASRRCFSPILLLLLLLLLLCLAALGTCALVTVPLVCTRAAADIAGLAVLLGVGCVSVRAGKPAPVAPARIICSLCCWRGR